MVTCAADVLGSSRRPRPAERPEGGEGMWTIVGVGVVALIAIIIAVLQRPGVRSDLGSVSDQWIAEHRLSQVQDTHR